MAQETETPSGVVRTASRSQAQRIMELTKELAAERSLRLEAVQEAATLANYIKTRAGSTAVWGHSDVMTMLQSTAVDVPSRVLDRCNHAQSRGIPPSYEMFVELVGHSFENARAQLLQRVGQIGEPSALAEPGIVTDRMREDLRLTLRVHAIDNIAA